MITTAFAVALVFAVGVGLWSVAVGGDGSPAPAEVAGYRLVRTMTGHEAMAEVENLHGTPINVVDAWIGHYEQGGTIWVAQAATEAKAQELVEEMVAGIEEGGTPFSGLTDLEFQGVPLYSVRDARQVHFFYEIGDRVVWLATPPGDEDAFLAGAMREVH